MKLYVRFVVSFNPIDPVSITTDPRHDVSVALECTGTGSVTQVVPQEYIEGGAHLEFIGRGRSTSTAIIDWLFQLCDAMSYLPLYRRRQMEARSRTAQQVGAGSNALTGAIEE